MESKWLGLVLIGALICLAGCLEPNMYSEISFEEINCTYSRVNVDIYVNNPAQVDIYTSEGKTSLFVREEFDHSYLVENSRKTERVLVTSGDDEVQSVIKLPQCACLLVDVRSEWSDPNLSLLVTGIEDASVKLTVNNLEKTITTRKGEVKRVNFTLNLNRSSEIFGQVQAQGRCEQNFRFSIDLKKVVITGGSVSYSIGEYVTVEKKIQLDGITDGFALNVGENSGNITVLTDGIPNSQARLQQNTLIIPGKFEELQVNYAIVPSITNGRLLFSDQVISQSPSTPIPVSLTFDSGYAPYYYDPQQLSWLDSSPVKFTTIANDYKKVVNLAYGPKQIRINLLVNASIIAHGDTSARLEVLAPKDTDLQSIESFQTNIAATSSYEKEGETYYVFEWENLTQGEIKSMQIQTQAIRTAGLFPKTEASFSAVNQSASAYWIINSEMKQEASSLIGKNNYESIYNVVKHVQDTIDYTANQDRLGASSAYSTGEGSCDEIADTTIGMLRYLDIPAVYVSGYLLQTSGDSPPGGHGWVKILDSKNMEIEPQELPGALDPYRIEFYTEYGNEKSRYWLYGNVTFSEVVQVAFSPV